MVFNALQASNNRKKENETIYFKTADIKCKNPTMPIGAKNMTITTNEMMQALSRSGYLLEVEVAKALSNKGFFVETSQVIEDPITGKSREIDIIAEYYDREKRHDGISACAKIEFVFEIKNNPFPTVLLNEFCFSPRVEDYLGLKEIQTTPNGVSYNGYFNYYAPFIENARSGIFTQYCSFHKKKENDELMALHPENIYTGISKIIQYCQEQQDRSQEFHDEHSENEKYLRHFIYMPILLLNDELYEMQNDNLVKVNHSILVINYYHRSEQSMAYVFVVTKDGLNDFISHALSVERAVETELKNAMSKAMNKD